ncbi:MAG: hypothetical protein ACD_7C00153G0006 [uncultured bacterium]|nr:MAG: hypothetical protein ACD_7C00153G0006 [uncultured bacterium]KKP68218.1 MAG: Restriction modification system DNA specificity domain-containing protein [Candidatus Moranbacteria bacterium GW2011_GWE1_35_17]KKP72925.1 MAG: Restriction modification system DNA specificity domain-containing protein [Candidatus Moranbacteria bacterium GW2011_GWE2_35_164]KKP83275.1 MAG: Restriction modification system DNA specificity domain-containing protein [Candidatus Moranbacteria bacterium GW2011_GWF1_35_5]
MIDKKLYNLSDVAEVVSGYSFRGAIQEEKDSDIFLIQAKDTRNGLSITENDLKKISDLNYGDKFVENNDVVMGARGFFSATCINSSKKIIGSSSVYIIKPDQKKVLSKYLTIYLNSKMGQAEIKKYETGSTIKTILIGDLKNIRIKIPALDEQKKIIELYENIQRQNKILERKKIINQNILETIFIYK